MYIKQKKFIKGIEIDTVAKYISKAAVQIQTY